MEAQYSVAAPSGPLSELYHLIQDISHKTIIYLPNNLIL